MFRFIKFLLIILLSLPFAGQASTLYLETGANEYGPGDSFAVDAYLDIDEECVNTVSASIEYPADYLSVIDFIEGESIINLWLDKPDTQKMQKANEIGVLAFTGGIPGGYCGHIPGDPGRSNLVARIIFSIPSLIISDIERDTIKLDFNKEATKVLLNDGFGTEDKLVLAGSEFKVGKSATLNTKEWKNQIINDKIRPEPFVVELRRDKDMFDNHFYIIFHAIDKQSGIDHYEVLETKNDSEAGVVEKKSFFEKLFQKKSSDPVWKPAVMPYVLEDQKLNSVIKVKAIDKAGNERFVEYIPPAEFRNSAQTSLAKILILLLAVLVALIIVLVIALKYIKKRKNHAKNNKEI